MKTTMCRACRFFGLLTAVQLAAATANATIIDWSTISVTTTAAWYGSFDIAHVIDPTTGTTNGFLSAEVTDATKYTVNTGTSNAYDANGQYLTVASLNGSTPYTAEFTFTGNPTIDEILIWNYSQSNSRALTQIDKVEIDTGSGYSTVGAGNYSLLTALAAGFEAQSIKFPAYSGVDKIQLTFSKSVDNQPSGFDQVGFAYTPVPEPSSFAMLLFGGVMFWAVGRKGGRL